MSTSTIAWCSHAASSASSRRPSWQSARTLIGVLVLGLLLCADAAAADPDFLIPEGYRAEVLDPLDGRIAIPADWKARRSTLGDGIVWNFAREFHADGSYETGLAANVARKSNRTSPRSAWKLRKNE
jgi:hypothetical protein